ncbi:unnamed protein product [Chrysoparadoxa australica]
MQGGQGKRRKGGSQKGKGGAHSRRVVVQEAPKPLERFPPDVIHWCNYCEMWLLAVITAATCLQLYALYGGYLRDWDFSLLLFYVSLLSHHLALCYVSRLVAAACQPLLNFTSITSSITRARPPPHPRPKARPLHGPAPPRVLSPQVAHKASSTVLCCLLCLNGYYVAQSRPTLLFLIGAAPLGLSIAVLGTAFPAEVTSEAFADDKQQEGQFQAHILGYLSCRMAEVAIAVVSFPAVAGKDAGLQQGAWSHASPWHHVAVILFAVISTLVLVGMQILAAHGKRLGEEYYKSGFWISLEEDPVSCMININGAPIEDISSWSRSDAQTGAYGAGDIVQHQGSYWQAGCKGVTSEPSTLTSSARAYGLWKVVGQEKEDPSSSLLLLAAYSFLVFLMLVMLVLAMLVPVHWASFMGMLALTGKEANMVARLMDGAAQLKPAPNSGATAT